MPRSARLDAPGVLHHVMGWGIERRKIFWNDKDRESIMGDIGSFVSLLDRIRLLQIASRKGQRGLSLNFIGDERTFVK